MRKSRATSPADKALAVISTAAIVAAILVAVAIAAASMVVEAATPARAEVSKPTTHVVEIRSFKFGPKKLAIRRGDVIVWINTDIVPHTATAKDGSWDTGKIDAGGRARMVVTDDLFRRYLCSYHGSMTGRLVTAAGK